MREINILNYYPEFLKKYKKITDVLKIEEVFLEKNYKDLLQSFDNTFFFFADENGVELFEKMMGIVIKKDETLEQRKNKIFIKWNATLPYTWKWLLEYLEQYYKNTKTIAFPVLENKNYFLDIRLKKEGEFEEYDYSCFSDLRIKIPANLTLQLTNILPEKIGNYKIKNAVIYRMKKQILIENERKVFLGNYKIKNTVIYRMKKEMI